MRAICGWSFDGDESKGQLSFRANDELVLLRETTENAGWGLATTRDRKKAGFVPLNYLKYAAPETAAPPPKASPRREVPNVVSSSSPPATSPRSVGPTPVAPPRRDLPPESSLDQERSALLQWVKTKIPEWFVQDFGPRSWGDGRALCALVNSLRPGTFDLPAQLQQVPEEDARMAIEAAETLLNIAPTISPWEIGSVSREAMANYIAQFQVRQRQLLEAAELQERARRKRAGARRQARPKPEASSVWANITGKTGNYHASIGQEGTVTDRFGDVLGVLDIDELRASTAAGEPCGYILGDSVYDCRTQQKGVFCGEMNRGVGSIHDANGSTMLEVDNVGCCKGHTETFLGCFEGCSRRELDVIALYCFFADRDFYNEEAQDEVERELVGPSPDAAANIFGKEGQFRGSISQEGVITDLYGDVIGKFDLDGRALLDASEKLLGYMSGSMIVGPSNDVLGEIDRGRGYVMSESGSSILTLEETGHCKGQTSVHLGEFRGFDLHQLDLVALYVLCLDNKFTREDEDE